MFDYYISLGSNCEPGIQFRRIGYEESSLLRFAYTPPKSLLNLLEKDFEKLFLFENLVPHAHGMVRDEEYNIAFHSKMISKNKNNEICFVSDVDSIYFDENEKVKYLVSKWRSLFSSVDSQTAYFIRDNFGLGKGYSLKILDFLREKHVANNFKLIHVQEDQCNDNDWGIEGICNEYITKFAPFNDVYSADESAWDIIFNKHPLKKEIKLQSSGLKLGDVSLS